MKRHFIFLFCFFLAVGFAFSSTSPRYNQNDHARICYTKGDVYVQRAEDLGYEEGIINLVLIEGDKLGTEKGRTEIHLGERNYLRLGKNTQLDIVELPQNEGESYGFHLLYGKIYLRVNFQRIEKEFAVHTPDASFYILEKGLYRLEVQEDAKTKIYVEEGSTEVAGEEGSVLVREEEELIASQGYVLSGPDFVRMSIEDNFSQWNRSREALHNRAITRRRLPSELYAYERELADNGRWVYEQPYGYVWVPRVSHYSWRPYYFGRWVWYPVIGWTWVSQEPWGWCVSHYGRWHWRSSLGWYWIPTTTWGPAWVHWYRGYDYVGWCPLNYYGSPVVVINNHFILHSNFNFYPTQSRALVVVRKNQLQSSQVSRMALSQGEVTRLKKISLSRAQPELKSVVRKKALQNKEAARVLSREKIRKVQKSYLSRTSSSYRMKKGVHKKSSSIPSPVTNHHLSNVSRKNLNAGQGSMASRHPSEGMRERNLSKSQIHSSKSSRVRDVRTQKISTRVKTFPSRISFPKGVKRNKAPEIKSYYTRKSVSRQNYSSSIKVYPRSRKISSSRGGLRSSSRVGNSVSKYDRKYKRRSIGYPSSERLRSRRIQKKSIFSPSRSKKIPEKKHLLSIPSRRGVSHSSIQNHSRSIGKRVIPKRKSFPSQGLSQRIRIPPRKQMRSVGRKSLPSVKKKSSSAHSVSKKKIKKK
ncbi:FecR domain-containing protein [bacterium]|nr:FecR domain-containing protein [bacterium]